MEQPTILIVTLSVITIISVITAIMYGSRVADLRALLTEEENNHSKVSEAYQVVTAKLRSLEKNISDHVDKEAILEKTIQLAEIKNAALQSKVDVLINENKKLLTAASDDITINMKVADDATVNTEKLKPKRKFYKKKSTGSGPKKG